MVVTLLKRLPVNFLDIDLDEKIVKAELRELSHLIVQRELVVALKERYQDIEAADIKSLEA